jgi:hypothetical protein
MPRSFCYFDKTTNQCKPCTKDNANCIGQAARLQSDIDALSHLDGNRENPLNIICQDWGGFASGTKTAELGKPSFVDCPASGCLGLAFTLPQPFTPKPYNDVGAKQTQTHCFDRDAWKDDALVALKKDNQLVDPLCGDPRTPKPSDFCDDPGRPTATVTNTPTRGGATPTNTATGPIGPTNTATRSRTPTASATVTRTGGATATATVTGGGTPTGTPTITPTPPGPTPTNTPVPATATMTPVRPTPTDTPVGVTATATATPGGGGGLSWNLDGSSLTSVSIPLGGKSYPPMNLVLVDSQSRFCSEAGKQPVLSVMPGTNKFIGYSLTDAGHLKIANIPAADLAGTYSVNIQTHVPCDGPVTNLPFSGAIKYGP